MGEFILCFTNIISFNNPPRRTLCALYRDGERQDPRRFLTSGLPRLGRDRAQSQVSPVGPEARAPSLGSSCLCEQIWDFGTEVKTHTVVESGCRFCLRTKPFLYAMTSARSPQLPAPGGTLPGECAHTTAGVRQGYFFFFNQLCFGVFRTIKRPV